MKKYTRITKLANPIMQTYYKAERKISPFYNALFFVFGSITSTYNTFSS